MSKAGGASSARAGFSTGGARRQEPTDPASSKLSVSMMTLESNCLLTWLLLQT